MMDYNEIVRNQREHWQKLATEFAGSVHAVGSESMAHKHLRYEKISELFEDEHDFSVHDIGPGIGDFYEYLRTRFAGRECDYSASEITPEYCEIAHQRFPDISFYNRDILAKPVDEIYDYVVLSGVFHQQGSVRHREWVSYMKALLEGAWAMARRGIAFNVLSSHADFYKPGNYYADLTEIQLYLMRRFSRFSRVDQSYPLFEATFLVYKPEYVRKRYPQSEFGRYMQNE